MLTKRRFPGSGSPAGRAVIAGTALAAASAAGQTRTLWSGAYRVQAERGRQSYRTMCGYCQRYNPWRRRERSGRLRPARAFFIHQWRDWSRVSHPTPLRGEKQATACLTNAMLQEHDGPHWSL